MRVVILGASRGLGLEFARQLAGQGHEVWATYRKDADEAKLTELGCRSYQLDLRDEGAILELKCQLGSGAVHWVILNAGFNSGRTGSREAPSMAEFDQVLRTNLYPVFATVAALGPLLDESKGTFVAISSDMASIAKLDSSVGLLYRASKSALNMVMAGAAHDFRRTTFLSQSPGWVRTDMGGAQAPLSAEESVTKMLAVIAGTQLEESGSYKSVEGKLLPW